MTSEEHILSIHEAGHGCYAAMSAMDVRAVVLHQPGSRQDEGGRCELHDMPGEQDNNPARFLTFLLAGGSAEYRAVGRRSARDASDREHATTLCALAILQQEPTSPAVLEMMRTAQALADAAMRNEDLWRWIERVARELVKKRRLTGRDIYELRPAAEARR